MAISKDDVYYFNEGRLLDAYRIFGAHVIKDNSGNITGTRFTVYAPHAKEVSVMGEFNDFQAWIHNLEKVDESGVWQIEIKEAKEWHEYKYEIKTYDGRTLYKSDPFAFYSSKRPETLSKIYDLEGYDWKDDKFIKERNEKNIYESQIAIYEIHLGTWMIKPNGEFHNYNELVDKLVPYLNENGFTHVEFMPIIEHPLDQSWGYQGTGYYSATSRFGVPKDLMYLVDQLHQHNISVILDWVPGHICKDAHGLYMFDGQALYEYSDESIRENIVWGTANLDLGKGVTQSFLISNALFWMKYFHVDGFRIDAVSNIIYHLGDSSQGVNQGALDFLKKLSTETFKEFNNLLLIAEDSTAYPKVTHPVSEGGLGFNYKWNMGWMNDTLEYFEKDPIYRKFHHDNITFGLTYAFSENYVLPLSHDEVVHGKYSLVEKMPGDYWQKFANYRSLIGLMLTHPGKTVMFMGGEFAQVHEWKDYTELDWNLLSYPIHEAALVFNHDMNLVVASEKSLHELDHSAQGFKWIDSNNKDQSVFSYIRYAKDKNDFVIVVLNLTPESYTNFNIGLPEAGTYYEIINSDKARYGGSNLFNGKDISSVKEALHGFENSLEMIIAPLSITILKKR